MRFLVQFRGLHNDLRLAEFYSVLSMLRRVPERALQTSINLEPAYARLIGHSVPANPTRGHAGAVLYGEIFYYVDLQSEAEARRLAARAVLLKAIYKPLGHGSSYKQCIESIDQHKHNLRDVYNDDVKPTFKCNVDAFGKRLSFHQQLHKIHHFTQLLQTFPGKIKLKNPDFELCILEDAFPIHGHGCHDGRDKLEENSDRKEKEDEDEKKEKEEEEERNNEDDNNNDDVYDDENCRQVFLGLKVAAGQGHLKDKYSLKRRNYIGPTSMDAELSFIMANMGQVKADDLVNDPFCGTCSTLIACSVLGSKCIASDINLLSLRGKNNDEVKGKKQTIQSNFEQYSVPAPLGILRCDVMHSPLTVTKPWFDSIICDPPYGIKEGTRVFRKDVIDESLQNNHFQGTERIRFIDFLNGLLQYAANHLVPNGRLVYWLPFASVDYNEDDVPTHPALQIVHNNVQPLTIRMSRRLITMRRLSVKEEEENRIQHKINNIDHSSKQRSAGHFDLARKLMRQPERAEDLLPERNGIS